MAWVPEYSDGCPKVGVLGDSIATLIWDELSAQPWSITGAFWPGVSCWDIRDNGWHLDLAISRPDHVVMIAGTNDCHLLNSYWNGFGELLLQAELLDAFPTATVHWVNLFEFMPNQPGVDVQAHSQGFNDALEFWAGQYPNLRLVDWNGAVQYQYAAGTDLRQADGVHPNQAGQDTLCGMVAASIGGN